MLGSERGVVEEWLSEFKVNCIEDENVLYDLYVVIQCIYVHGETETKVIKWEWQYMK